jgi:glucose/mannose transport system permease protein
MNRDIVYRWQRIGIYAVLILFSLVYLLPFIVVLMNSVRDVTEIVGSSAIGFPKELRFSNWSSAWRSYCLNGHCSGIAPFMWNSLAITIPATIFSTMLGALNGYSLALWRFRGDNIVFGIIVMGIFLPEQMRLIPWANVLAALGLSNTVFGLAMIHTIQGISFATLFCRNYYLAVPPELLKAANMDGAGFFRIFWSIILPISPPILIVTVIWQFTGIWNEFLYGVVFTSGNRQPVTAALVALTSQIAQAPEFGIQSAAVIIAALPPLLIYIFGGRFFVRGLTAGAVK